MASELFGRIDGRTVWHRMGQLKNTDIYYFQCSRVPEGSYEIDISDRIPRGARACKVCCKEVPDGN